MRTGIITYEGRHKWVLRTDELYEGQAVELDWMNFLPEGIGSRYKRARIISSSKEFLKLKIERPLRKWRGELSAGTVVGWFRMIRVLVRWMIANDIWQFCDLTSDNVMAFLKSRRARHSDELPAKTIIVSYIYLIEDLWTLRHSYSAAIRLNVRELEDDIWLECRVRDARPWSAVDEEAALALIFDSLTWIQMYGEFFIETANEIFSEQSKWVGLCVGEKKKRSTKLFATICSNPVFDEISKKCGSAKNGPGLAHAFTCTIGAAINVLLFTVGQRVSELLRLDEGCLMTTTSPEGVLVSYVQGIAAKKGGLVRTWVAGEPVPEVITWLERLYKLARDATGIRALFVTRTNGASIPLPGRRLRRMSPESPVTAMRAFAGAPFRTNRLPIAGLHPHAARKTFAVFVVSRDKTALEALSLHFGHAFRGFTDGAYAGNLELQRLLSEADRRELGRALNELLTSARLAGRAAKSVEQFRGDGVRFRGKLFLQKTIDDLIAKGVRLAPCNWGYCLYSEPLSACGGDHVGPNELRRSPEVCSGCANFVVSSTHTAWWNERAKSDEKFLQQRGVSVQARQIVEQRMTKSREILRQLVSAERRKST
jgi:hypothetical protein